MEESGDWRPVSHGCQTAASRSISGAMLDLSDRIRSRCCHDAPSVLRVRTEERSRVKEIMAAHDDHDRWMAICLQAAEEAARAGDFPNGACVVVEQQVVAISGSEAEHGTDSTAHAEVASLRKAVASGDLPRGATLFTTLEPCAMCLHSAAVAGVKEIVFACSRSEVGDDAYVSKLDATAMAKQLIQPLTLTHHGDPNGRVSKLVLRFLSHDGR